MALAWSILRHLRSGFSFQAEHCHLCSYFNISLLNLFKFPLSDVTEADESTDFKAGKESHPDVAHYIVKVKGLVNGLISDQSVCHVDDTVWKDHARGKGQVPHIERDPIQAVVDRQNHYRRNMINEKPYVQSVWRHQWEKHSPEEERYDNFENHTRFIEEDAPFPSLPGWMEVGCNRLVVLLEQILFHCKVE